MLPSWGQIFLSLYDTATGAMLLRIPVSSLEQCHQLGSQYLLVLKGAAMYVCGF